MKLHIIAYPEFFTGEVQVVNHLLRSFDVLFHLRKPEASPQQFEKFLQAIELDLQSKIILHDAYDLIHKYPLHGLHFSTTKRALAEKYTGIAKLSTSCHSLDEVKSCEEFFDGCFLSPIYPSISKKGYEADFDMPKIGNYLSEKRDIQVIALGGVTKNNIQALQQINFDGAGVLGTIWGNTPTLSDNYNEKLSDLLSIIERPYCLSIAGFDPSAGAGVLSDIKTFEANNCYGFAVNTALTYQNDNTFEGLQWLNLKSIISQLEPLCHFPIKAIKIGLVESFDVLLEILNWCKKNFPDARVIWDPILKASAGFTFHKENSISKKIGSAIDLITPNAEEYEQLNLTKTSPNSSILLKGGHRKDVPGSDTLFLKDESFTITGKVFDNKVDKHGTGCVLSSAIAANLAKGDDLLLACKKGKSYVEQFIQSNKIALGYHNRL